MKQLTGNLNICALLMTTLILFQSCVVYHKTPVSFEVAAQAKTNSMVVTPDGAIARYKYILLENSEYFGVNRKAGVQLKTRIEDPQGNEVYLKNQSKSDWATVGLIFAPVAVGFFVFGIVIPVIDFTT
ncbi:hypothetical protein [Robiginitalea sp. SC105]|uniref:hypothetical protein n=1 Tax=Robiginitalea sp. SC105 TaxID=2762332 RepID=UPI00163A3316|nr:hypothetical protein [Robiginitalea sp. SC105]MBC2838849.1 hypothetical protein [Robiginitalea sp. SC105]